MVHRLHVDLDFNWTGEEKPETAFEFLEKLGQG